MLNIENLVNDGNPDVFDVYDDGKCKHNSFEARLNTKYLIDGITIDITGYGYDREEAIRDLINEFNNSYSKLEDIIKPIRINDFYIIPNKTKFVCTIRPILTGNIILVEDAILKYDKDILAYVIESEKLDKVWIYATIAPYVAVLKIL